MGIEIIKLDDRAGNQAPRPALTEQDLAPLLFSDHVVGNPPMSVWLLSVARRQPLFPWWTYRSDFDKDINRLHDEHGVTSAQSLFDYLFFYALKANMTSNLFVVFPGNIRRDGWEKLTETERDAFARGQGCVYRLDASCGKKLAVNWVPYYQPQSLVREPTLALIWRLFLAARNDDHVNNLCFFQAPTSKLPQISQALIQNTDKRSEMMAELTDWFGVYSSPMDEQYTACSIAYARTPAVVERFHEVQRNLGALLSEFRQLLLEKTTPSAVSNLLTRLCPARF